MTKPKLEIAAKLRLGQSRHSGNTAVSNSRRTGRGRGGISRDATRSPGVKGASAAGIVAISVGKTPSKNEFFRMHHEFRPIVPIVDVEVGMEKQYFAVNTEMVRR